MKKTLQHLLTICGLIAFSPAQAQSPTNGENYIIETTVKTKGKKTTTSLSGLPVDSANRTIQYLDGLGRPLQTVQWQGSPGKRDLVIPVTYDNFGRTDKTYLPYAAPTTSSNGSYKSTGLADQNSFYTSPGSSPWNAPGVVSIPGNTASTATIYENSPLNRVLEQGAPGSAWQPLNGSIPGSGHTVKTEYGLSGADALKIWTVNTNGASVTGTYGNSTVYKNRVTDENNNSSWEYKDKEGRVIGKATEQPAGTYLYTRYVYDDLGNLRYVMPPGSNPEGITSFTESSVAFTRYIYAYKYDSRNRIIAKKIPGKGWQELIYNPLDQLVFSQDAVQAQTTGSPYPYRSFIKYDGLGRVVMTGIEKDHTGTREVVQDYVNNLTTGFWESRDNSVNNYHGYNNISCPWNTLSLQPEVVNYYDDYTIPGIPNNQSASYTKMTRGLLTATKTKVLGTSDYLWTINYYDDEGRVVRIWKQHYQTGVVNTTNTDQISNTYDFSGNLTASTRIHKNGSATTTIVTSYTYDHSGRKLLTKEKINTGAEIVLSKMEYNEIGQLSKKNLHSTDNGVSYLQNTQYAYNERGWLKTSNSDQFSQKLKYDDGSTPQYNGNIANQEWGSGTSFPNVYTYSYDQLNRLISGISTGIAMSEILTYDVMGNIKTMKRDGAATSTYNYNGNTLNNITGGTLATTGNYTYDANGNMTTDSRTGVALSYNQLNLPVTAVKTTGTAVDLTYTYDATGRKLKKVSTAAPISTRHYIDGIEYNSNTLDIIRTEEGQARNNAGVYSYEYNLTDHLGNVRYTFNKHPTTGLLTKLQQDDYYPFGMQKVASAGANKYLYNGKELQSELGQLDYGARFYDPVIGRWGVVDPLAEKYRKWSPYNYGVNNPLRYIDPDGMGVNDIHLKFQDPEAKKAYINTVNKSLGGAYTASTVKVKDGKGFSDKVVLTKGDGSKATAEQKAFSELYSGAVNSKTVVRQEVVSNSKSVEVGNFDTNQIDISDVQQFDKAGKGGATSAGTLIHETIEQLDKASQGMGPGESLTSAEFDRAHQKATKAENRVNGNIRVEGDDSDVFKEKNGTKTRQAVSSTSTGGIKVIKDKIK